MARANPQLTIPMARTSGLAVPMTKASALSVPSSKASRASVPRHRASHMRASGYVGNSQRDAASFMNEVNKLAEAGAENMDSLLTVLNKPERGGTRISYTNLHKHIFPKSTHELLDEAEKSELQGTPAAVVVENISPSLIKALGAAWELEPEFFAMHTSNPPVDKLWRPFGEWKENTSEDTPYFDCLDGIYEFHDLDLSIELMQRTSSNYCSRHVVKDSQWPVNVNTKITYMRVSSTLYLFLVDPPPRYEHAIRGQAPLQALPTIRFPYAQNRGGVLLPSPYRGKHFVPFSALERIFRHAWQLELLFHPEELFPNVPFLYLMSFSLWYSRLHRLDKEIKRISFQDIRAPDLNITNTLHDIREDLSTLQNAVANTQYYASQGVTHYYRSIWQDFQYPNMLTPLDGHLAITKNAEQLHRFLLETFQLLMNTLSVRDSQTSLIHSQISLRQTQQSVILTRLAAFYLPWTLSASIYGMNLKQLNQSGLDIYVFVVTGVALVVGTMIVFHLQSVEGPPQAYMRYFHWTWWKAFWRWRWGKSPLPTTS